ncbi:MAG: hypothetical protein HRT66_13905 [Flavobacteriaceae bacterium]|nr:hypothetical protein [Flavobacteriaceae bacterium]
MSETNIWLGLVEIKPKNDNTIIIKKSGAYVNVAYRANSEEEFIEKTKASFLENDYEILGLDYIENATNICVDNPDESEKIELLNDIIEGNYDFSWGVFHTYD